jgi:phosphoserine phosphatase
MLACKAAGLKVLLVSGGFTFFADRVRDRWHRLRAQQPVLEMADGASSPAAWSTRAGATSATAR